MMVVGPGLGTLAGTLEPTLMCAYQAHIVLGQFAVKYSIGTTRRTRSSERSATSDSKHRFSHRARRPDEKEQLESIELGEWKSAHGGKRERLRYSRYAKATFRKDRRLNIRFEQGPGSDPEACAR